MAVGSSRMGAAIVRVAVAALLCAGCMRRQAQNVVADMTVDGWDATDTLHFEVPPVERAGEYAVSLLLRTAAARPFPYTEIALGCDCRWFAPDTAAGAVPAHHPDSLLSDDAVHRHVVRLAALLGISTNTDYRHGKPFRFDRKAGTYRLLSEEGEVEGAGISLYQYAFAIDTLRLERGVSARISVYHRQLTPYVEGVRNVGVRVAEVGR